MLHHFVSNGLLREARLVRFQEGAPDPNNLQLNNNHPIFRFPEFRKAAQEALKRSQELSEKANKDRIAALVKPIIANLASAGGDGRNQDQQKVQLDQLVRQIANVLLDPASQRLQQQMAPEVAPQ